MLNYPSWTKIKKLGFQLNWDDLSYGFEHGFLNIEDLNAYLNEYLALNSDKDLSLVLEENSEGIKNKLIELSDKTNQIQDRKNLWILIFLVFTLSSESTRAEKLEDICFIYDLFGNPEEMWDLVYFHKPRDGYDPSHFTLEENRQRLLEKCEVYRTQLKDSLAKNYKFLLE